MKRFVTILAILLFVVGCSESPPPAPDTQVQPWTAHRPISPTAESSASSASNKESSSATSGPVLVWSANTSDCDTWPHYDWPLVFQIDVPPVPKEIAEPAPPITEP